MKLIQIKCESHTKMAFLEWTLMRTSQAIASLAVLIPPAGLKPTRNPVASWYSLHFQYWTSNFRSLALVFLKSVFFSPDGSAHDQADRQDGVHPLLAWAIETINFCWFFLSINNHYFLLHFSATTSFTSTSICIIYYFYYISLPVLVLMKSLPAIMQTREAWTIWTRLYNCQMLQLATAILWISSPFILCL